MKKADVIDAMLRLDAQENAEIKTERKGLLFVIQSARIPEKDEEREDALRLFIMAEY